MELRRVRFSGADQRFCRRFDWQLILAENQLLMLLLHLFSFFFILLLLLFLDVFDLISAAPHPRSSIGPRLVIAVVV